MDNPVKNHIVIDFTKFENLFKQFFDLTDDFDTDGYAFKSDKYHENLISDIKQFWVTQMMPLAQDIIKNHTINEHGFFKTEFESFYKHVIHEYFGDNYQPNFRAGRPITENEYKNLNDSAQEWYQEVAPFAELKKELFELLRDYKAQVNDLVESELMQQVQATSLNDSKPKINPTMFEEIFVETDFQKYIDALRYTEPPLLNDNMEFIGKKRGGTGEVGLWIAYLRLKRIINPNISRQHLGIVFSSNIKNLYFGKDARTISYNSTVAHTPILKQLIKRTGSPLVA